MDSEDIREMSSGGESDYTSEDGNGFSSGGYSAQSFLHWFGPGADLWQNRGGLLMFDISVKGLTSARGRNEWFEPRYAYGWASSGIDRATLCIQSRRAPHGSAPVVIEGSADGLCRFLRLAADVIEADALRVREKSQSSEDN